LIVKENKLLTFILVSLGKTSLTRLIWSRTISRLFHTNWALLGPELDELEVFLHAP